MVKVDKLGRALSNLPSEAPSDNLPDRVFQYVRIKRRRKTFLSLVLHFVLVVSGLWLVSPLFTAHLVSASVTDSALSLLLEWVWVGLAGIETYVNYAWNGFTGMQSNIVAPISVSVGLGVAVLTLSVLLALGQMLSRSANLISKGENA
ncbi:MAG: hypothetical protein ABIF04_02495 [Chloroflexota bacterium]